MIVAGVRGWIAWQFSRKLGISHPAWMGVALIVPGSFFPIFFTIRGWVPATTLSESQSDMDVRSVGQLEPWVRKWLTGFSALPLLLLGLMIIVNSSYMLRIFDHWIGILLVAVWLALYVPTLIGLRRWYWTDEGKSGKHYAAFAALAGLATFAGTEVILLGPALITLVTEVFGY